ncbi:hypothetical protein DRV85_16385 [Rhodosalinus halophilus]|jgi:hypothetical protein|uniref:Uncharacterized protein n=1 Tax=Rhodosalinus halophilus TaxID=2259333 RepID=A0A365U7A1_9RHOB|nr:hypothetical protein [Rhodosalinus halophilus]RBI83384.1 hypothetical protein DRV85_16385 [Rhodosalinus halophilus]
MLFTLIVAGVAGAATPYVQDQVTEALYRVLGEERMPDAGGRRVAAFATMLLAAAILLVLVSDDVSPVLLVIGGTIGAFQKEIRAAISDRMG